MKDRGIIVLIILCVAALIGSNFFIGYEIRKQGTVSSNLGLSASKNLIQNNAPSKGYNNGYPGNQNRSYAGPGMRRGNASRNNGRGGMMGGVGVQGNLGDGQISSSDADKEMSLSLSNAQIDKQKNTITYSGNTVKIVMLGGTRTADDKFVVGGLINPELVIPKGAQITLELINEDEDVPHGVQITNAAPGYSYMPMMDGGLYPGSLIQPIAPASNGNYSALSATFTAAYPGSYYYICEYPGHAEKGMYGRIIFK